MSEFIKKLEAASRGEKRPMGFGRAASEAPKRRILLVAAGEDFPPEVVSSVDALLSPGGAAKPDKNEKIPWGVRPDIRAGKPAVKNGADYVVITAEQAPLSILAEKKAGKVLGISPSITDVLLRAVNDIGIDAVLLDCPQDGREGLTLRDLLEFRRFTAMLSKPVIVTVPASISDDDILAIWEAGVVALLLPEGISPAAVRELRERIDKLTFPTQRKGGHEGLFPRLSGQAVKEAPETSEEEEEDGEEDE